MTTLTAAQEAIDAGTWQLDPAHSRVGFSVGYLAGTFHGEFSPFEATLAVDEAGAITLAGKARVDGVKVADENLGAHLLSPEFFDAEQAPEITFTSSRVESEGRAIAVDGELAIRGITKPVRLEGTLGGPVVDPYDRRRLNLQLATTIDRSAFGVDWNVPLPSGDPALAETVEVNAELALIKA